MFPKKIKQIISSPIPKELIKQREGGGGKKLNYISGSTVIDILNVAFDYDWDWNIERVWIEKSQPYLNKWLKDNSGKQVGGLEEQAPVAHVLGYLTIRYQEETENGIISHELIKSATGSKVILGKASDQDSIFKAAATDALKKAASLIGIGLELYRDEEEQSYYDAISYENPWTEELLKEFETERTFIKQIMKEYDLNEEEFCEQIQACGFED